MTWTSPRTWVAAEKPTAATFNLHVRDNLLDLYAGGGGGWTSYTPTIVGTASPTLDCRYIRDGGKMVTVEVSITMTATLTATLTMTLPSAPVNTARSNLGGIALYDTSSGAERHAYARLDSSGNRVMFAHENTTPVVAYANATLPWTWAAGDQILGVISYREA